MRPPIKRNRKVVAPAAPAAPVAPVRPDPEGLKLVLHPAPVLRRRAAEVKEVDEWVRGVVKRMKQLMVEHEGVGLAAPQVGLGIRLFVWSPEGTLEDARAIINPVITEGKGEVVGEEGCLSLPEIRAKIVRHESLHVEGVDEVGNAVSLDLTDYPARIIQHENDHLDGVLILDRMSPLAKLANRKKIKELEGG